MAQISIIQKSDIAKASNNHRFDSDFFRQDYLNVYSTLNKNSKGDLLSFNVKIKHPKEIKREFVNKGIWFLRAQNVRPLNINSSNKVFISRNNANKLKDNLILENDILITRTGANFGQCALYNKTEAIASSHTFIVKSGDINPYLLSVFFNTTYGRKAIDRGMYGGSQPEITPYNLLKIPFPNFIQPFQLEIEKIVKQAHKKQSQAKDLYAEAENLLLTELDLVDYQPKHQLAFSASNKDIEQAGRFDAEYFQPKYADIINRIENYSGGFDVLDEFISNYSTGYPFKSSSYVDNGCYLIRINNIEKGKLNLENANKIPIKDIDLSLKDIAKEDDILISMSGTIGNACRVPKNTKAVINQRIFRFTPKNFETEVLTLLINSIVGLYQLEMIGTGGVQTNISGNDIRKIKIPLINQKTQNKIAEKITLSHQLRKESKDLLELAKTKVEQAIENPTLN